MSLQQEINEIYEELLEVNEDMLSSLKKWASYDCIYEDDFRSEKEISIWND